jgi:hypothetical protein
MKKSIIIVCLLLLMGVAASSCAHKTCPAYRGSIAENVEVNE